MHPIRLVVVVDPMILILTFKDDAVDENMAKNAIIKVKPSLQTSDIHPRLDLVNVVVRHLLFIKLRLFTKSSLNKE